MQYHSIIIENLPKRMYNKYLEIDTTLERALGLILK